MREVDEKDWKLFKKLLPIWQENYMKKLIEEYKEILQKDSMPFEKFGELEKRINSDKKCVGVYAVMKRSLMFENILNLTAIKAITIEDLEGFSVDIKNSVQRVLKHHIN